MSAEKTLELLKKLKEDPKAKELLDGLKNTASSDDVITCYAQIASKLGYDITAEEIREVVDQEEARRKAQTEKIASDIKELNDDDVKEVAGGGSKYRIGDKIYEGCAYTQDGLCVVNDACFNTNFVYACDKDWSDPNCVIAYICEFPIMDL